MRQRAFRLGCSVAGVAVITYIGRALLPVNALTVGFAYLLLVLILASTWGFLEALLTSLIATIAFNFFFLPPIGTFTIADPQNWIALFSFLATSLIAGRLSAKAEARALEAIERQRDIERLYAFSRAILLIDAGDPFPRQLAGRLAEIFDFGAVVLYDRRTDAFYRAGPSDFEGMEEQVREAAREGETFSDTNRNRVITTVRLGAEPIAGLALQGGSIAAGVLQGIANLVAIGLERARAQEMAHLIEAARQSEQLRTTLIDAMAHEFKTPLTSIKAATTSLLAIPEQPLDSRMEMLRVADEEADHLKELIDDSIEMARLSSSQIQVQLEESDPGDLVRELVAAMHTALADHEITIADGEQHTPVALDRRLVRLALRQLLDNAAKYSPSGSPIQIRLLQFEAEAAIEVANGGKAIPAAEQSRIFERFYRSPGVKRQVPGSGLGLSIAQSIARAHKGDLTVTSQPGETVFRLSLPMHRSEAAAR